MNFDRSKLFLFTGILYWIGGISFLVRYFVADISAWFLIVAALFLISGTFNFARYNAHRKGK